MAFILEEGFPLSDLKRIIDSISETALEAGVKIVTGDTKVVEKGTGDGIYINTCGVGFIPDGVHLSTHNGRKGDLIAVTGPIGNHEMSLMLTRNLLTFKAEIESDVAPLNKKVSRLLKLTDGIKTIKDPTRGGLASALVEIAENSRCEIVIYDECIPVDKDVQAVCDLAGLDPLYLANEGKYIIVCNPEAKDALQSVFSNLSFIGKITRFQEKGRVLMETSSGGLRKMAMLETAQLPRIC